MSSYSLIHSYPTNGVCVERFSCSTLYVSLGFTVLSLFENSFELGIKVRVLIYTIQITMLLHCPFIIILAACATPVKWSLANEVLDHGGLYRSLQDTTTPDSDDTCAYVCDNIDEPSIQVQVVEVEAENVSLFGSIMNRFNDFFDNGSRFGQFMNGLLNLFRPLQSNKPKYKVSTDVFVSALTEYSTKAKNLAASMRSESASYAAASTTPDAVITIFELSAENMDSVAAVIGPMLEELGQHETIDLTTVSCYARQLLTQTHVEIFSRVGSIAKVLYTKSGNEDMEEMYDNYMAAKATASASVTQASTQTSATNQCPNQGNAFTENAMMESSTSFQARVDSIGELHGIASPSMSLILWQIVLLPISIIVSIVVFVFSIFVRIISVIFQARLFPDDNTDSDIDANGDDRIPDDDGSFVDGVVLIYFLILIGWPIVLPIYIIFVILQFFGQLLLSIFPCGLNLFNCKSVLVVLESPMKSMVNSLNRMYRNDEDAALKLDCELKNMTCHNEAMMASLSF